MDVEEKVASFGLSTFALKMIAVLSMAIDHTGAVLFPSNMFLRIIGRLAFPIYAFVLVEGFFHTRDVEKYAKRLGLFALISEIPFDLAFYNVPFYWGHQNIYFTLFLGILTTIFVEKQKNDIFGFLIFLIGAFSAEFLHTDYGSFGILIIGIFYGFRRKDIFKTVFITLSNILLAGGIQSYAAISMIPILFYNGKKGPSMKYFFYSFYLLHLLVLYVLSKFTL